MKSTQSKCIKIFVEILACPKSKKPPIGGKKQKFPHRTIKKDDYKMSQWIQRLVAFHLFHQSNNDVFFPSASL